MKTEMGVSTVDACVTHSRHYGTMISGAQCYLRSRLYMRFLRSATFAENSTLLPHKASPARLLLASPIIWGSGYEYAGPEAYSYYCAHGLAFDVIGQCRCQFDLAVVLRFVVER